MVDEEEHGLVHAVKIDVGTPLSDDVKPVLADDDVKTSFPSPAFDSKPSSTPSPPRDDKPVTLDTLFSPASPRRSPPPLSRANSVKFDLGPQDDMNAYHDDGPSAGPSSRATSAGPSRKKMDSTPPRSMLIPDLPLAWDDALASFDSLERCVYERKDLGLSREQDDMMVCDCTYDAGESGREWVGKNEGAGGAGRGRSRHRRWAGALSGDAVR